VSTGRGGNAWMAGVTCTSSCMSTTDTNQTLILRSTRGASVTR
jgi:hypothetical protein